MLFNSDIKLRLSNHGASEENQISNEFREQNKRLEMR